MRCTFALIFALFLCAQAGAQATLPSILLVGYLPPSNEMLRGFSANPAQNPGAWVGANWEQRGFNVFAYFPEFTPGAQCMGIGDFAIDYQDTTADFRRITRQLRPVAIVTFSVGPSSRGWGLEPAYLRWRMPYEIMLPGRHPISKYLPDCTGQRFPYNSPVLSDQAGNIRFSNLPMGAIAASVAATLSPEAIRPFVYPYDPRSTAPDRFGGNYLSGYIAYLAAMYRERNQPPTSATPCYLTGHVHVGHSLHPPVGTIAVEITLREVISTMNSMSNATQTAGGACCDPDGGSCMYSVAPSCPGMFLGPGTACGPAICPPVPMGSCCLINGTCTLLPHTGCDFGPRIWTAGGSCVPNACAAGVPGVCCRGATCNTVIGPGNCSSQGAAAGAFYSLLGDACEPPLGRPRPCCHADYNKNGFVSALDIFDFLHDWFDASPFASVGSDGASRAPRTTDIFDFLSAWFLSCP